MDTENEINKPKNATEYIAGVREDAKPLLIELHNNIREIAPKSTERISYGMPMFFYYGPLIAYSVGVKFCSLHTMSGELVKQLQEELKPFSKTKEAIHFTAENPISKELLTKIVQMKIEMNKDREKQKDK